MKIQEADKIIFLISGGVGKNIIATAVVKAIRREFPKKEIVVATPHTLIWKNNPNVDHLVDFTKSQNFYEKYFVDSSSFFMGNDPYLETNFIYKRKNLMQIWTEMFGIEYKNEQPEMFFTEAEKLDVKNKLPIDKPIFMLQTSGGPAQQEFPISWMRDMPLQIAQEIVDEMISRKYRVVHFRRPDQYSLEHADHLNLNLREYMCAIQFADKCLFIDSVAQHAAAAVNKPSVVAWVGNTPDVFGYKLHTNLTPNKDKEFRHMIDSYLDEYNIHGTLHECPYNSNDLFDKDRILEALDKLK